MSPEAACPAELPSRPEVRIAGRLDDQHLIALVRGMSMGERLECGFKLCEFASELAGAARR